MSRTWQGGDSLEERPAGHGPCKCRRQTRSWDCTLSSCCRRPHADDSAASQGLTALYAETLRCCSAGTCNLWTKIHPAYSVINLTNMYINFTIINILILVIITWLIILNCNSKNLGLWTTTFEVLQNEEIVKISSWIVWLV